MCMCVCYCICYCIVYRGCKTGISWICPKGFVPEIWHSLFAMTILIAFSKQITHLVILDTTGNNSVCEILATANEIILTQSFKFDGFLLI